MPNTDNYMEQGGSSWKIGGTVDIESGGALKLAGTQVTATADELNRAADATGASQELTASGAVTAGARNLRLNHASTIIAATVADAAAHAGLFTVTNVSASGTAAHKVTLTSGTWDGTNNIATLNAPAESLVVFFDGNGNGTIVVNTGAVALS